MADMLTTDPFFALTGQVSGVREKVSDSIFENYKLQVAQTTVQCKLHYMMLLN
jgi:hypothetical protein